MSCAFGFDPFDPEPEEGFAAHVDGCPHCAEVIAVTGAARSAWNEAKRRDDLTRAPFREQRLLRGRAAIPRRSTPLAIAVAFALGALVVSLLARYGGTRREMAVTAPVAAPASSGSSSVPTEATTVAVALAPEPPPLVVVSHQAVSLTGAALAGGASVNVPRGGHLTLGFAIDAPAVDVVGPASIRSVGAELALDEGALDLKNTGSITIATRHVRVRGEHCASRVTVGESETRIEHTSGVIVVEARSGARESRTIREPSIVVVGDEGSVWVGSKDEDGARRDSRIAPAHPPHPPSPQDEWKAALAHLERGERAAAEAGFVAIAHSSRADARLRARASFRAGELAFGRRDRVGAAAALTPLLADADPALASDAALLLARNAATPSERAAIWDRLLARDLPEPYRAHALRERGERASIR